MDELDKIIANERSTEPRFEGWTKLHHACDLCLPDCVKLLLAAGADVNARTSFGWTPLYIACRNTKMMEECARLLIAAGADPNILSNNGWAPLHIVCSSGAPSEYIELILSAGANINAQVEEGWTPLHVASNVGYIHAVRTLLEAGADFTIRNKRGLLPRDVTIDNKIKDLLNNFGLDGGCSTKEAI